jgi:phage/plasmid-like protein (TIGR03299 family)
MFRHQTKQERQMSHELSMRKNGKAEMAYVGMKPWHGLGQELKAGASIAEWAIAAGMDWKINRSIVRYATARDDGGLKLWPDKHVLFRSDSKEPLGMVSDGFQIVQPAQVLEFFRDLVGGAGFTLDTAGTLFGGKKFWALAKIGEEGAVLKGDTVKGYLLLATACDGSMNTEGKIVATRVVCNNTISIALREQTKNCAKVSHKSVFNPTAMKKELGLVHDSFQTFMSDMRHLTQVSINAGLAKELTFALVNKEQAVTKERTEQVCDSAPYKKIIELFDGKGIAARNPGVKGTAWGWLNAVTEYVDHHRRAHNQNNRLNNAWFGGGDDMKTRAAELVLVK